MVENQILFYFFKQSVHHRHLHSLRSCHLEQLDGFRENQLAVHTLLGNEANHTIAGEQFLEFGEGASATVADVVVAVVTECDGRHTRSHHREIRRGVHLIAQDATGFAILNGIVPERMTILILQLTEITDTVLQYGMIRKKFSPVNGSTEP